MTTKKLKARIEYEAAVLREVETLAECCTSDAQAIVEAQEERLWQAYELGVRAVAFARLILDMPAAACLDSFELVEADSLCRSMCQEPTLDRLIDKWEAHGYRPTFDTKRSPAIRHLADLYDRRALQRGILVAAFRI